MITAKQLPADLRERVRAYASEHRLTLGQAILCLVLKVITPDEPGVKTLQDIVYSKGVHTAPTLTRRDFLSLCRKGVDTSRKVNVVERYEEGFAR